MKQYQILMQILDIIVNHCKEIGCNYISKDSAQWLIWDFLHSPMLSDTKPSPVNWQVTHHKQREKG